MTPLRIGTRGSALAQWQAELARGRLTAMGLAAELVLVRTTGDRRREAPLRAIGGKGIFIKELEDALLDARIDLAVHSMKDVPTELLREGLDEGPAAIDRWLDACGRTVGEELLRPTHIYVPEAMAMLRAGVVVKGFAHISGDGLLNLTRLAAEVSYRIDRPPDVPPIFDAIQRAGQVADTEMYRVFNMGVGFCAVVSPTLVGRAIEAVRSGGGEAFAIGEAVAGPSRRVELPGPGLVGLGGKFEKSA